MTPLESLSNHRALCDELYQLALEENRFMKEQGCAPGPEMTERKRALLARLDQSLAALRALPRDNPASPEARAVAEQAKARMLQFLHLDKENEQWLLRHSLAPRPPPAAAMANAAHLKNAYQRPAGSPPAP